MILICILYVLCSLCLISVPSQTDESPLEGSSNTEWVVTLCDGRVRGRRATTIGQQRPYFAFQGIPYAEPPVGNLRFKAPVKKSKWSHVISATEDKSQCLQGFPPQGSEDCLYINVYVPAISRNNIPVMVWIHGGGFSLGNSSYNSFGPDYLLDENIVFVSFNYRLGIFGFGSTGDSVCPGNFGFKDQILALKWVQENIASFKGDPKQVTIFGQSAGGASVSYLVQATRNLFKRAIMSSGTSLCLWALDRKSREAIFATGKALNISTQNSADLISSLRKVDSMTLQQAAFKESINITVTNVLEGLTFGPVKEKGIVADYSEQALSRGQFLRIPVIIGLVSNETASVGGFPAAILSNYLQRYKRDVNELVPIDLTQNTRKISRAASKINSFYFGTESITNHNQTEAVINFLNDDLFYRAILRTVEDHSKYVPVYFYKFSYSNGSSNGVAHADDNKYIFAQNVTLSEEGEIVRSRTVKLWTNFAKFGNPTPKKDGSLQNITWLRANSVRNKQIYLNIDSNLELQQNPFNTNMEFWKGIYNQFGDPPYDTY